MSRSYYLPVYYPPHPSLHLVTMLSQTGEHWVGITSAVKLKFIFRHPGHLGKHHSLGLFLLFTTLLKSKDSTEAVCTHWILAPWRPWLCESSPQWCPQVGSRHPRNPGYCLGDWLVTCRSQNNLITLTCHLNLSRHIMLFSKNLLTAIDPSWHSISISQAQLSSWPSPGISFISLNRVGKALCAHWCFLSFGLTAPKVWY